MSQRPDFKRETTDLQHLATKLSDNRCTVTVLHTTKYHAELVGEGVENRWGFSKKIGLKIPLEERKDFDDFICNVRNSLFQVTPERSRRF